MNRFSFYVKFILAGLFIFTVSCRVFLWYPDPVPLSWADGDIVFVSDRATPDKGKAFSGPLYFLDINHKRWAPIKGSEEQFTLGIAPTWSPDGSQLAFVTVLGSLYAPDNPEIQGQYGTIFLDTQGQGTRFGDRRYAVTWSSNNQYVAFYYAKDENVSLKMSHPDGANEQILVSNLPSELYRDQKMREIRITWSPDSRHIAYDSLDDTNVKQIWLVSITGGSPGKLVVGSHPAWSPLGDEIAFDRNGSVWIINIESGKEEQLVIGSDKPWLYDGWPAWSPDGQQLAFVSSQDGNAEIYRINRDGSGLENLTNNPSYDAFPAWRPILEDN